VLLCKSACLVRKRIEALFNYCFVWRHNKVHIQCHTWALYFLHKCWILDQMFDITICSSSWTDSYFKSICGISNYSLIPQFLCKHLTMFYGNLVGKHWSEQWKVQFQSNDLYSYQWMQPYCRCNWEIRGNTENTEGIKNYRCKTRTLMQLHQLWLCAFGRTVLHIIYCPAHETED